MPNNIISRTSTAVDHVVDIEKIGPVLHELLKGIDLPVTGKADDPLRDLLTHVSTQTNIDFQNYKPATILRRIGRRIAVTNTSNIREYADYLRTHPDEVRELVKAFLIRVTGFFRDPDAFEIIKQIIVPI